MRPGEKALTRLTEYTDGRDPSTSKTDSLRSSIFSALDDNLLGTGYWVLGTRYYLSRKYSSVYPR